MTDQLETRPTEAAPSGPDRRLIWVLAALVAAVVVGLGLWFVASDDDGLPTVTFDGQSATYDGPSTFEAGEVRFEFDASAYERDVVFVIGEIRDDGITYEEIVAWFDENPGGAVIPPFMGSVEIALAADGDFVLEETYVLQGGMRYLLSAITPPEASDRVYPAAIIETE